MDYGIVFFRTRNLDDVVEFYTNRIGIEVWLEQSVCTILRYGTMLLGFCQGDIAETEGCITFVADSSGQVDKYY
jgi:hypothetical protein